MKLEQQVTSVKLSKRLKKLGVKQDSKWYWDNEKIKKYADDYNSYWMLQDHITRYMNGNRSVSAFTVAELGEMLPDDFTNKTQGRFDLVISKAGTDWFISYRNKSGLIFNSKSIMCPNGEANARAKMLIYLLENKLTK